MELMGHSVTDFQPIPCDQTDLILLQKSELTLDQFTKGVPEGTRTSTNKETDIPAPLLEEVHQLPISKPEMYHLHHLGPGEVEINSTWHIDFQDKLENTKKAATDSGTIITVLPATETAPTTRYIQFNGTIEIPHFVGNRGLDSYKTLRNEVTHRYIEALIEKYTLEIASVPGNTWIKVPRFFIHASPTKKDHPNSCERGFCLVRHYMSMQ